jgi:hypothetical protein
MSMYHDGLQRALSVDSRTGKLEGGPPAMPPQIPNPAQWASNQVIQTTELLRSQELARQRRAAQRAAAEPGNSAPRRPAAVRPLSGPAPRAGGHRPQSGRSPVAIVFTIVVLLVIVAVAVAAVILNAAIGLQHSHPSL